MILALLILIQKKPTGPLRLSGKIITVIGWGGNFDGIYNTDKLSNDSCVSGNCEDGHGRKIFANITSTGPSIRIMEGKFKLLIKVSPAIVDFILYG